MFQINTPIKLQRFVVIIGFIILVLKFFAYYITSSNAILTDAVESIVNVTAGIITYFSIKISLMPKDDSHPYGHGKVEFLSAGVEGTLILIAGILMIGKALYNFVEENTLHELDYGIYITSFSGLINYFMGFALVRLGNKEGSIALRSSGEHLKSDAYTTVGMILGLALVFFTGIHLLDNIIAIIFGGMLVYTGFVITKESISGIMDEADEKLLTEIISYLNQNRRSNWIDFHNLRVIKYGANLHIDAHLTVPRYLTAELVHSEMKIVEELIKNKYNTQVEIFLHPDPCRDTACHLCTVVDCPIRKSEFKSSVAWNLLNVSQNKRHGDQTDK